MKRKTFLSLLLAAVMFLTLAPITALAAGTTNVWVDNTLLTDGENSVGDGTATLNKEAGTLTLENIQASKFVQVLTDDTFTVVVKGNVSIGSEAARTSGTALYSTAAALKIQIEQGAELSLYTENGNNVYVYDGSLTISGPGTLTADAIEGDSGAFPSLVATKDITLNGDLVAELVSEWHGAFSEKGNIVVDSADLTVYADSIGLFAQTYDEGADAEIPSSITLKDSHVTITSYYGEAVVFCGTGGLVVENSVLDLTADKDSEWGGYGLYSEGDIVIRGENTEIDSDDAFGIEAGDILYIEGGQVRVASTDTALLGWNGVVITGGTIDATSEIGSVIIGRDGPVSITGAGTSVTATAKGDDAAIRNANDGGIFLAAPVTAVNTQGGKPFLGVNADKSVAITLGEGYDLFGAEVYTDATGAQSQSYFIPAGGSADEPLTSAVLCKHVWNSPEWTWTEDYSEATATFVCKTDPSHTVTVTAAVTEQTTAATCGKDGSTVYTASAELDGTNYGSQKTVVIPATGAHKYEDGKCTVCGAADPEYKPEDPVVDPGNSDNPDTGDYRSFALWSILTLLAGAALTGAALVVGRQNTR